MVQTSVESRRFEDVDQMYNRFRVRRARVRFDGSVYHDKLRFRLGLDLVKGSETDDDSGSLLMDAYAPIALGALNLSFRLGSVPLLRITMNCR